MTGDKMYRHNKTISVNPLPTYCVGVIITELVIWRFLYLSPNEYVPYHHQDTWTPESPASFVQQDSPQTWHQVQRPCNQLSYLSCHSDHRYHHVSHVLGHDISPQVLSAFPPLAF